jgi:hypothetical protein
MENNKEEREEEEVMDADKFRTSSVKFVCCQCCCAIMVMSLLWFALFAIQLMFYAEVRASVRFIPEMWDEGAITSLDVETLGNCPYREVCYHSGWKNFFKDEDSDDAQCDYGF